MGIFAKSLGVDPGTAFIRVCKGSDTDVFSAPSLAAVDSTDGKVLAVGEEAEKILCDTPGGIKPLSPIRGGAVADYDVSCEILKKCISRISGKSAFKCVVVAPVSGDATDVEIRALRSALTASGAKKVQLIETVIAAALGAGVDVDSSKGKMIMDIGAGRTDIAVICMGEVFCGKSIRVGGKDFDNDIINYVKKQFGLSIGEKTAEAVKISIGSVCEEITPAQYTISGREFATGLPGEVTISSAEVGGALSYTVKIIIDAVRFVLERIPVELIADISLDGIILTGGGAKLKGLPELIKNETGIDAVLADCCETAVARGCAIAFDEK